MWRLPLRPNRSAGGRCRPRKASQQTFCAVLRRWAGPCTWMQGRHFRGRGPEGRVSPAQPWSYPALADAGHWFPILADAGSLGFNLFLGNGVYSYAMLKRSRVESFTTPFEEAHPGQAGWKVGTTTHAVRPPGAVHPSLHAAAPLRPPLPAGQHVSHRHRAADGRLALRSSARWRRRRPGRVVVLPSRTHPRALALGPLSRPARWHPSSRAGGFE